MSVLVAGEVEVRAGWPAAFLAAGAGGIAAFALVAFFVRPLAPQAVAAPRQALFDFRPVLRNDPAMAYTLGYAAHIWELFGFLAWLVPLLVFVFPPPPGLHADSRTH